MSHLVTCPKCGQRWSLTAHTATPGHQETSRTYVPIVDVNGATTGHRMATSEHWVWEGQTVQLVLTDGDGTVGETLWACSDHIAAIPRALYDRVDCLACRPRKATSGSGAWWKEHVRVCSCCGVNGSHDIPRVPGPDYTAPDCGATVVTP